MLNNKIKIYALLIFIFCLLPFQMSFGAYSESGRQCATFENGNFVQFIGLEDNEYCKFTDYANKWGRYSYTYDFKSEGKSSFRAYNSSNLTLTEIKVPYAIAENIWNAIKNTSVPDSDLGANGDCNEANKDDLKKALYPYYVYDAAKIVIQSSCLPGSIAATVGNKICDASKLNDSNSGCLTCTHRTDYTCWPFNCVNRDIRYETPNIANYQSWSFPGCKPLEDAMSLTVGGTSAITGKTDLNGQPRKEVKEGGSFTLDWNISNPSTDCAISGINPTLGGNIDKKARHFPFENVKSGIYAYTLTCAGVLNGQTSSERGARIKKITVYTTDIPPSPSINTFSVVTPNKDLTYINSDYSSSGSIIYTYQIPIGKAFKLKWDVANSDSITIDRAKSGRDKTAVSSSSEKIGEIEINTKSLTTGLYSFIIEVKNTKYPELGTASLTVKMYVGRAEINAPIIQFSADKTEIEKNEKAILTWNITIPEKVSAKVSVKEVSIDKGIGKVSISGSKDIHPSVTTTYTLTAVNSEGTEANESLTIKVKKTALPAIIDLKPVIPPPPTALPEGEGRPSAKETINLKVNDIDGPITLNTPATFTLSWNLDKYCLATGSWLGIKLKAGTQSVTLKKNGKYTYSLYCPGYGSDSVAVNIVGGENNGLLDNLLGKSGQKEPMPIAEAAISADNIIYSQNIKVIRGEPTDIYIKIDQDVNNDGRGSRDASGQWSDLMADGGRCLYNAELVSGVPQFDSMIDSPTTPEECNVRLGNFTFNDKPGTYRYGIFRLLQNDNKFSNISYANITVENPPLPETAPIIDLRINGNDEAEQILGTPAKYNLIWNVVNADFCEASGSWSDSKPLKDIQSFVSSVKKDFIYTLTCVGKLGTTTKSIALKVVESPVCGFTALPPTINKKSAFIVDSELSWKCEYSDECSLSPGIDKKIKTYGTMRVSPDRTTTYILNCSNSAVSRSFEVKVEVQ